LKLISIFIAVIALSSPAMSMEKTICGSSDDRRPSFNPKVGRSLKTLNAIGGCTVTMIGRTCAITAGHCAAHLNFLEFNTPLSRDGRIQHPEKTDIYEMEKGSLFYSNNGKGKDYAVARYKQNEITGRYPGDAQGFYPVSLRKPRSNKLDIVITGYGIDNDNSDRNMAQQVHSGKTVSIGGAFGGAVLKHTVDTMGGNSGSSIINKNTGKIIGIHTHGGCYSSGGTNHGTAIAYVPELVKAIKSCLDYERNNL